MNVTKLRIGADENGLVPAGEYFKRLAGALRDANAREGRVANDRMSFNRPQYGAHAERRP